MYIASYFTIMLLNRSYEIKTQAMYTAVVGLRSTFSSMYTIACGHI